jgi:hypothetical protein
MSKKKSKNTRAQKNEKYQVPQKAAAKIPLLPIIIILIAVFGIGYFAISGKKTGFVDANDVTYKKASTNQKVTTNKKASTNEASQEISRSKVVDWNIRKLKGGETKPVLSPARFTGKTANSYKVAQENPELMDSMYCYCYCKKTIGHKSLLSCFADMHASKCTICQDQAFYAKIMQDKGLDIGQVRKEVDRKYWRPFS